MRVRFEEEEYFVMAMFEKDSRIGTMEEIRRTPSGNVWESIRPANPPATA